ncbi:MAG: general secretion pathway protein GspB [Magnetococcales bacterium]|nr:hypothetical protein [Magnetococcales bacterium]NGZ29526.1 general secretion pathway protein GspB [Magnetococcales bacterium]
MGGMGVLLLLAANGWTGETPDPTRPPEPSVVNPPLHRTTCVEMVLLAADRRMVLVDGVRLQEKDQVPAGIIRQINHNGILVEENGVTQRYPVGNCPPVIQPTREK